MFARLTGAVLMALTAGCQTTPPIPTDAQDLCLLPPATFATWFQSGSVSLNGVVKPADSTIMLEPNCDFYQWAQQDFLWLTSPAPSNYGGGAHIFDSPT